MIVGVDIGSRTIKTVALKDGRLQSYQVQESGFNPHLQSLQMIKQYMPTKIVATGYGRHLAQKHFAEDVITEIKAHAIGARYFFPNCRTVLDVGGQDCKVISLDEAGRVVNFQMNDKCAAGTGRFLEVMAASLGILLSDFGNAALQGSDDVKIGSMCTVFAESEVISLKNRGIPIKNIARAVHTSVVERIVVMLHRAGFRDTIVFTGGVAKNRAMIRFLQDRIESTILVPEQPDIVGALGAALYAVTAG